MYDELRGEEQQKDEAIEPGNLAQYHRLLNEGSAGGYLFRFRLIKKQLRIRN